MNSIWVYIWRFQPFHNGHKSVVDQMLRDNQDNIIIIGTLDTDSDKNIYSAKWRQKAIKEVFPILDITCLSDNTNNSFWVKNLKKILEKHQADQYIFYCGDEENDYAIKVIKQYRSLFMWKDIEVREISRSIIPVSGTQIRKEIKNNNIGILSEFVPRKVYWKINSHLK